MSGHGNTSGGQDHNERSDDLAHFDEVDAVRRFPAESDWLELPMPEALPNPGIEGPGNEGPGNGSPGNVPHPTGDFVNRVMQARGEEQQLDAQLAELDTELPAELLRQFQAPVPSEAFVDRTVNMVQQDRRQRWQQMLSRYVAPEPSTVFVSRTLAALGHEGKAGGTSHAATSYGNAHPGSKSPIANRRNWPLLSVLTAAAAAILWLVLTDAPRPPLELRLAKQASPIAAYAHATTPMAAIFARVANEDEPFAMFDEPVDGLWLASSTNGNGELR